jgi:Ca-activated chloride channel homolog
MNLLAPAALGLAALAAPIVAMYILKMRRPTRVVPSTFLWEQALRDVQANAPWQRLRPNLLLLLQLLAVAVLVLALARPYVLRAAAAQGDVVAVLDGSALMTATDVSPSRFAVARARIAALIDGLGPNDVMSIVLMARHAHVLIAESADRAALHAALDHATPTSETPDPGAAVSVATALARGGRHATIFIYTAAGDPAVSIPVGLPARTQVVTLGGQLRDLGVVAFAATRSADGTVAALARVANLGRRFASGDLQLDAATGDPANLTWHPQVDLHPVSLAPGSATVIARTRLPGDLVAVRAHLIGGDDREDDDRAWAVVPAPAPRRVLLVTPSNPFLPLALSLAPGVRVDTVTPERYTPRRARGADLVVFDTWLPARLPAAAVLAVGPPANAHSPLGLPVARPIRAAGLQPGDDPGGLLENAGVGSAALDQATPLGVPPWAYAVLRTSGQPVLVAGQNGTRREAVLGFQVFNTDWVLQPGFPILVQNLLHWLAPPLVGPSGVYRPGDAVPLAAAPSANALWVVDPARHRERVAPPFPAQPFVDTGRPGLYTVEQQAPTGVRRVLFAVNPFPVPQAGPQVAPATRRVGALHVSKAQVPVELAPLVAALALVVLAGEWWVAARRR